MAKDMLGTLVKKIVDLPSETLGVVCDLAEKLASEVGWEWLTELKKFLRKEKCWVGVVKGNFLKLISGGESLVLDAVDGTETLANARDVFAYIDPDLKNWGTDDKGSATEKASVVVYEMCGDATFAQMFGELSSDTKKLCLTQHQIKKFVKKFPNWFCQDGYSTFFLFESNGNFFVASVSSGSSGEFGVGVDRFEYSRVWDAGNRRRVVAP